MKTTCLALLFFLSMAAYGQHEVKPTQEFTIIGEVKAPAIIRAIDLKKWKEVAIGDVVVTNHLGEKKSDAGALKGVLLKEVLQSSVEIVSESPKVLSEIYFVCQANDGYTVVYSWNELFNTVVGETVYIITEREGKSVTSMEGAIQMMSPKDFKTGRRSLKALSVIAVKRAKL